MPAGIKQLLQLIFSHLGLFIAFSCFAEKSEQQSSWKKTAKAVRH